MTAREDLDAALNSNQVDRRRCTDSQQAVEKAFKAILCIEDISFPKTHDIQRLYDLIPAGWNIKNINIGDLSSWSIDGRYPYGIPAITYDTVNFCVSSAKDVYDSIESEFRQRGIL